MLTNRARIFLRKLKAQEGMQVPYLNPDDQFKDYYGVANTPINESAIQPNFQAAQERATKGIFNFTPGQVQMSEDFGLGSYLDAQGNVQQRKGSYEISEKIGKMNIPFLSNWTKSVVGMYDFFESFKDKKKQEAYERNSQADLKKRKEEARANSFYLTPYSLGRTDKLTRKLGGKVYQQGGNIMDSFMDYYNEQQEKSMNSIQQLQQGYEERNKQLEQEWKNRKSQGFAQWQGAGAASFAEYWKTFGGGMGGGGASMQQGGYVPTVTDDKGIISTATSLVPKVDSLEEAFRQSEFGRVPALPEGMTYEDKKYLKKITYGADPEKIVVGKRKDNFRYREKQEGGLILPGVSQNEDYFDSIKNKYNTGKPKYSTNNWELQKKFDNGDTLVKAPSGEYLLRDNKSGDYRKIDSKKDIEDLINIRSYKKTSGQKKEQDRKSDIYGSEKNPNLLTKEEQNNQKKWLSDYIKSDKFKERLSKEGFDNPDKESKERLKLLNSVDISYVDKIGKRPRIISGTYDHKNHIIKMEKEYDPNSFKPSSGFETIPLHEMYHASDKAGKRISKKTESEIKNRTISNDKEYTKYLTTPTEFIGRIQPTRYLLNNEKIYDASKEDFNDKHYERMMQNKNIKSNVHFQEFYNTIKGDSEEERKNNFIWFMNNIASVDNVTKGYAQEGGEIDTESLYSPNFVSPYEQDEQASQQLQDKIYADNPGMSYENKDSLMKWLFEEQPLQTYTVNDIYNQQYSQQQGQQELPIQPVINQFQQMGIGIGSVNTGQHNPGSRHYQGRAFDIPGSKNGGREGLYKIYNYLNSPEGKRQFPNIKVINEIDKPAGKVGTANHLHIEILD